MLKFWNVALVIITFALTIFGTFLTRSGILSSVHAFSDSAVGPLFLAFIGVILFLSFGLLVYRSDRLQAEGELDSLVSRESAFLVNNLLLLGFAFAVLLGDSYSTVHDLKSNPEPVGLRRAHEERRCSVQHRRKDGTRFGSNELPSDCNATATRELDRVA